MNAKRVMNEYVFLAVLYSMFMGFSSAIYVLFLESKGLDLFEQGIVNACFFSTLFLMEIPTGIVADRYGRKFSFLVSCGLAAIGLFIYGFSNTTAGFILAEVVLAIGITFKSGAFRAWFVDRLKHFKCERSNSVIFAQVSNYCLIASVVSAIIGAKLFQLSAGLPWFVSGIVALLTLVAGLFCKEEYFVPHTEKIGNKIIFMKNTLRDFGKIMIHNKPFRFVVLIPLALKFFVAAPNMHWQHVSKIYLPNESFFGYVFLMIRASMFLGAFSVPYVLSKIKCEKKSIFVIQIFIGLCLLMSAITNLFWLVAFGFLLHEFGRGAIQPIIDSYMHDNIESRHRATLESCAAMVYNLAGILGLLVSGYFAKQFGINVTWIVMSFVLVLVTSLLALKSKVKK